MTGRVLDDIGVCCFDAYGTLFDVGSACRGMADDLGESVTPLSELWRRKQLEYTWLRTLMGRYTDFWHITGQALDYALDALKMDDPALRARLMQLYLSLDAYPEVRQTLGRLKAGGIKTAVLSNGAPPMLTAAIKSAGLSHLIDKVLHVDKIQVYKPRGTVYELATDWAKADPHQIAFMSSNGWDVAGAATFGFKVVWVNRAGNPPERLPGTPAAEVDSLDTLPDMLGVTAPAPKDPGL